MYKIVSHSNQCYRIVHADVDRHRRGDLHHGRVRVRVSHLRMRVRHLRIDIISIIGFPPSPICIFQIMSEFEVYSRWFRQPPNVTPEHTHSFLYVRSFFGIGKYALTHADSGQPVSKKNPKRFIFLWEYRLPANYLRMRNLLVAHLLRRHVARRRYQSAHEVLRQRERRLGTAWTTILQKMGK